MSWEHYAIFILLLLSAVLSVALLLRRSGQGGGISDSSLRDQFRENRSESAEEARKLREELAEMSGRSASSLTETIRKLDEAQGTQLREMRTEIRTLSEGNERRIKELTGEVAGKLESLQKGNEEKLEKMRQTVDEKLQGTLERRLGESFKLVSDRLEAVHKGLGEMQELATGVGDLKAVLSNAWGAAGADPGAGAVPQEREAESAVGRRCRVRGPVARCR